MKKIVSIVCVLLLCLTINVFGGCDTVYYSTQLDMPQIKVVGNTIIWGKVEDATEYCVYKNDGFLINTSNTYYVAKDLEESAQFYIVAKNAELDKESEHSNSVVVYKQVGFSEEEKYAIDLKDGMSYVVPSDTNYVYISGISLNASIFVADRSSDLCIELNNVTISAPENKSCIYGDISKSYGVTIIVNGNNILSGGDCTFVPSIPSDNTEQKGINGGEGGSGIILPKVAFSGNGSIVLNGGAGGKGGTGAASTGFSPKHYGFGGDGGNGGCGIKTKEVVLSMDAVGTIKAYGGEGGVAGAPGSNGSIVSGPIWTGSWKNYYGNKGLDGKGLEGEMLLISGMYTDK